MRWLIFKAFILLLFSTGMKDAQANSPEKETGKTPLYEESESDHTRISRRERTAEKYRSNWNSLIPHYTKLQFAGGMGVVSAGIGWDYGKTKQWETDFFVGILPRFSGSRASATITFKQNYIPWRVSLGGNWSMEPLETGIYLNKLTSRNFWGREPEKYNGPYYKFSTNLRVSAFVGQRFTLGLSDRHRRKSITAFYELSTNDLYLISALSNKAIKTYDILVLSLGLKFQFL